MGEWITDHHGRLPVNSHATATPLSLSPYRRCSSCGCSLAVRCCGCSIQSILCSRRCHTLLGTGPWMGTSSMAKKQMRVVVKSSRVARSEQAWRRWREVVALGVMRGVEMGLKEGKVQTGREKEGDLIPCMYGSRIPRTPVRPHACITRAWLGSEGRLGRKSCIAQARPKPTCKQPNSHFLYLQIRARFYTSNQTHPIQTSLFLER